MCLWEDDVCVSGRMMCVSLGGCCVCLWEDDVCVSGRMMCVSLGG